MNFQCHASVNSSCALPPPPPPGNCGAFAHPVSSGGGALANLARPRGRAFAYLGVLTHSWFPTRNPNMEDFIAKDEQFVADWIDHHGLDKLVEVFSILCISSLLIKAQLELSMTIYSEIGNDQRESTYACFFVQGFK